MVFELTPMFGIEIDLLYSKIQAKYGDSSYWLQESFSAISFPVYGRLSFASGTMKPYVLGGIDMNYLFGDLTVTDSNDNSTTEAVGDFTDNSFLVGLGIGAGVSFPVGSGFFDIGLRYRTNLNEIYDDLEMYLQSINVDLAYGVKLR